MSSALTASDQKPDLSSIEMLQEKTGKTIFFGRELMDIYYRVLSNAKTWEQGLGYFRLSAMKLLAYPLSKFIINNDGRIKIYCNEKLSERDYIIMSETGYTLISNSL
jgi:hypothetical protein